MDRLNAYAMTLMTLVGAVSCGRSAEPVVACPAPAADCATLLAQQQGIEARYAGAADDIDVDANVDATVRQQAGECVVKLATASLDLGCVDRCVELCRLHPCPVLDDAGVVDPAGDCAARCATVVAANATVNLDTAITVAAEEPGLCTCRGCGAPGDALCTSLFDCAAP